MIEDIINERKYKLTLKDLQKEASKTQTYNFLHIALQNHSMEEYNDYKLYIHNVGTDYYKQVGKMR